MNIEGFIQKVYERRLLRIILHILFWLLLSLLQWYLTSISFNQTRALPGFAVTLTVLTSTLGTMLFYYPFVYLVLPKFIVKRKYISASALTLLLVVLYGLSDLFKEEAIIKTCTA
jgi:glycopeptide antibiotics resistance protein